MFKNSIGKEFAYNQNFFVKTIFYQSNKATKVFLQKTWISHYIFFGIVSLLIKTKQYAIFMVRANRLVMRFAYNASV